MSLEQSLATPAPPYMNLRNQQNFLLAATLSVSLVASKAATTATVEVQVDRRGAKINPAMWGVFFEDINFGADGGLH